MWEENAATSATREGTDGVSVGHVSSRGNHCALFGCMAEQEKMMMMERKPNVGRTAEASVAVGHHLGIGGGGAAAPSGAVRGHRLGRGKARQAVRQAARKGEWGKKRGEIVVRGG